MKDESVKRDKLRELESSTPFAMSKSGIDEKAPKVRGLYAITCEGVPNYAYVGQAKERAGTRGRESGLWERLGMHWKSAKGDNLAKHLMKEAGLPAKEKYDLRDQCARRQYFSDRCKVQVVSLDGWKGDEIDDLEKVAVGRYCPPWNKRHKPKSCAFRSVLAEEPTAEIIRGHKSCAMCKRIPVSMAAIAAVCALILIVVIVLKLMHDTRCYEQVQSE